MEPKLNEKDWLGISRIIYTAIIFIAGAVFVGGLLMVIGNLPLFGSLNTPAVNEVYARYLEQGIRETGAVNAVTGMILDYRAFDTFGESAVLFTAVLTVMLLLNQQSGKGSSSAAEAESGGVGGYSMIIQTVTKAAFPFVLLYGCYIILNGHLSPGGGFSGGTILGAALILYRSVFGERAGDAILTKQGCMKVSSTALLCYACLKGYSFFTGANHLESIIPTGVIGSIFSGGLILPLNIAVGLIVACTMYLFYQLFEGWRCEDESSGRKLL
ncbi:MAG: hypothetical protein LIP16_01870 [Clostridium sp.]|nr:hypothetical protein [Clostridium sp.]